MWTENEIQTGWKFPPTTDVYNQYWEQRRFQYPVDEDDLNEFNDICSIIDTKGYHVIKNLFSVEEIDNLYEKTKKYFVVDDKTQHRHKKVDQPLINSPEIIPYVFNDYSLKIALSYMKCYPAIGTLNFRKSFVNDLEEEGVQMFHIDPNSPRFLKFFLYLNDVDEQGGPFCIVEGSNHSKHHNRYEYHRWPEEEIIKHYGKNSIKQITANKGDMIVASTSCYHRGVKCISNERTMLTLNYVIHPEEFLPPTFQMRQSDIDSLPDYKKPLTDFLIPV